MSVFYFPLKLCFLILNSLFIISLVNGDFGAQLDFNSYKLATFTLITPIVKANTCFHGKLNSLHDWMVFAWSVIVDSGAAYICLFVVPFYLRGIMFGLLPILFVTYYTAAELFHYFFLNRDGSYVVKLSFNPLDHLLVFVITSAYLVVGLRADFDAKQDHFTVMRYVALWIVQDAAFGIFHYYTHIIPSLWARHRVHHEYKHKDLNSFANFYADFFDSFMMNAPYLITAGFVCVLGHDSWQLMTDLVLASVLSHNKYCSLLMGTVYLFEFDVCDLLVGGERVSTFHNRHHLTGTYNFAGVGFLSDDVLKTILPTFGFTINKPAIKE